MAHLEQDSADKEESAKSDNPNGIKGMMEEFIVHLAQAVKEVQQDEKHCYHCSSLEHFTHLNQKEGTALGEGRLDPSSQGSQTKGAPRGDTQGIGCHTQTPFLNPDPFH